MAGRLSERRAGRRGGWLRSRLSLLVLTLLSLPVLSAPLTHWRDDLGKSWQVPAQLPERWVVLGPHLVDMMLALGARDRIVGVQDDHPLPGRWQTSLSGLPVVGQSGLINEERLRLARPDLIVFWPTGLSVTQQDRLRRQGIALLAIEPRKLADIPERLRWLGALAGKQRLAEHQADAWQRLLRETSARHAAGPRLKGFYQVWQTPLYTLAPDHLVSQAMRLCGVDSIVPASVMAAPVLSPEAVLQSAPDIILVGHGQLAAARQFWARFPSVPAVRNKAIVAVPDRDLTRPGLSLLQALPMFCHQMQSWRAGGNRSGMPSS